MSIGSTGRLGPAGVTEDRIGAGSPIDHLLTREVIGVLLINLNLTAMQPLSYVFFGPDWLFPTSVSVSLSSFLRSDNVSLPTLLSNS